MPPQNVVVLDLETANSQVIYSGPESDPLVDLSWSPDGERIAFSQDSDALNYENVAIISASGGKPFFPVSGQARLINNFEPAWSPDGSKLIFARTIRAEGSPSPDEIGFWEVGAEGGGPARLAVFNDFPSSKDWAPVPNNACGDPHPLVVNSTDDDPDEDEPDKRNGICDTGGTVMRDGEEERECTLRAAIEEANARTGLDTITFDIPGPGPYVIRVGEVTRKPLPEIINPVGINGISQTGYENLPIIELEGTNAGDETHGLKITAGKSVIAALVINEFSGNGILIEKNGNNAILDCFIGTDRTGTQARPNAWGVVVRGSSQNYIGAPTILGEEGQFPGNLISGNFQGGIAILGSSDSPANDNQVQSNLMGTRFWVPFEFAYPTSPPEVLGFADVGILVSGDARNNVIGGRNIDFHNFIPRHWWSGEGNIIAGHRVAEIHVNGALALANRIEGNELGYIPRLKLGSVVGNTGVLITGAKRQLLGGDGMRLKITHGRL